MTPKERVKIAMDLGVPDRIPLMCQLSVGHMLQQIEVSSLDFWFDKEVFSAGLIKLRQIYDFDGILVSLHGHDPNWKKRIKARQSTQEGEEIIRENGDRILFTRDDLPQVVPAKEKPKPNIFDISLGSFGQEKDLPEELDYIPVSQELHFEICREHKFDVINSIIEKAGEQFSIHGEVTSPFDYFLDLLGHQDALMALIDEPEKSKLILDHFAELVSKLTSEMCDTGVDAIKLSSPFAGAGFISPKFYSGFVLPFESKVVRAAREKGVHIYIHTCGAIGDRLELLFDSGASGIECLDPPPLGNVELKEAKAVARNKGFIKGNVDSVNTLLLGTDQEITEDTHRRLEIGKDGGGFILSTACSIAPRVKRAKILLLREAVERWG